MRTSSGWSSGSPASSARSSYRSIACARTCSPDFREDRIEPPGPSRVERILGAGRSLFERRFTHGIVERLPVDGDRAARAAARRRAGRRVGRAEERSGQARVEHDPGGGRQARACPGCGTSRRPVRRLLGEAARRVARPRGDRVPVGSAGDAAAGQADAAGGAVLDADRGDHRRAGRPADRRRGQDPHARGEPRRGRARA